MPTASQAHLQGQLLCLMGPAGTGKSQFAMQAPQPHAVLCVDKPVIAPMPASFPDYDPEQTFAKFYPPPAKDLTNDKALPSRNIFDEIIRDIETIKVALHNGAKSFAMGQETWPLPKTIILEGMDFVRDHCINWTLHTQGKLHMDEFLTADGRPNVFLGWGLVASKMDELFQNLAFLPSIRPVNVVVTIGLDGEKKREKVNGKVELVETGNWDPAFGGKMSTEAPRKFRDCWLTEKAVGKYFIHTAQTDKTAKFRGLRSGRFGLQAVEDVTLTDRTTILTKDHKQQTIDIPYVNQWNRLFGGEK